MMILHNMFFHNTLNQVFSPFLFTQSTSMIKKEESDTKKNSFYYSNNASKVFDKIFLLVPEEKGNLSRNNIHATFYGLEMRSKKQ